MTENQRRFLDSLPDNQWVRCPRTVHIRTLLSLVKKGLLEHKFDDTLPVFVGRWSQPYKRGYVRKCQPEKQ